MRVLLLDHTSIISGAQRALLDLMKHLPDEVEILLACPEGELAAKARADGHEWMKIRGTEASYRLEARGTLRALGNLTLSAGQLWKARDNVDLVHANSSRAGLIAAAANVLGGPQYLVHLHDVHPSGVLTAGVYHAMSRASGWLAISEYVAGSVSTRHHPTISVVFSPLDLKAFQPAGSGKSAARLRLGLDPTGPWLGVIGQLTPWKAQDDAIRILASLRNQHPTAKLLIVGEAKFLSGNTRFDNRAYARRLMALPAELGVSDTVRFLGDRDDVPAVLATLDVLMMPSWEEPLGRVIMEAMAMALPVVATAIGGAREIIDDHVTGFLVRPRAPERWVTVVSGLLDRPATAREIGTRARQAVKRYDAEQYARRIADLYRAAIDGRGTPRLF